MPFSCHRVCCISLHGKSLSTGGDHQARRRNYEYLVFVSQIMYYCKVYLNISCKLSVCCSLSFSPSIITSCNAFISPLASFELNQKSDSNIQGSTFVMNLIFTPVCTFESQNGRKEVYLGTLKLSTAFRIKESTNPAISNFKI